VINRNAVKYKAKFYWNKDVRMVQTTDYRERRAVIKITDSERMSH